jgi:hypothetical protein
MPPPMPNTMQQPHIPQNFAPTGRKKALLCACNYRWALPAPSLLAFDGLHSPIHFGGTKTWQEYGAGCTKVSVRCITESLA